MKKYTWFLVGIIGILSNCGDVENPPSPNEEELITTVRLEFTNKNDVNDKLSFVFSDPDGDGGNPPIQTDTVRLKSSTSYILNISFLDESNPNNIIDITDEIREEGADHLICLTTVLSGLTLVSQDLDENNLAIGLVHEVSTGISENGTMTISLKHQPEIKNGSCDVGETDVEVSFVTEID
jgi:hypothetical protein